MAVVLRLVGLADGRKSGFERMYVKDYSPDGHGGRGSLQATSNLDEARRFGSLVEAMEEWRRVSATHPTRRDGKPNRPLTAYTVEMMQL